MNTPRSKPCSPYNTQWLLFSKYKLGNGACARSGLCLAHLHRVVFLVVLFWLPMGSSSCQAKPASGASSCDSGLVSRDDTIHSIVGTIQSRSRSSEDQFVVVCGGMDQRSQLFQYIYRDVVGVHPIADVQHRTNRARQFGGQRVSAVARASAVPTADDRNFRKRRNEVRFCAGRSDGFCILFSRHRYLLSSHSNRRHGSCSGCHFDHRRFCHAQHPVAAHTTRTRGFRGGCIGETRGAGDRVSIRVATHAAAAAEHKRGYQVSSAS